MCVAMEVHEEGQRRVWCERFIMVRGHFLGGYFRPDIVTWILQGCLDGSYHVAPTVCQADDYPLRGHTGSAMRSAAARPRVADREAHWQSN